MRIVTICDTHCGSVYGLTPPKYQTRRGWDKLQNVAWNKYVSLAKKYRGADYLFGLGDLVDGTQRRQGGAELIMADRNIQVEMAYECIVTMKPKRVVLVYGTAYHTGEEAEDFEYQIAEKLKNAGIPTRVEGQAFPLVCGVQFDLRHHLSHSSSPQSKMTGPLREGIVNKLNSIEDIVPFADVIMRAHIHEFQWYENANQTIITCPSLQMPGGRFGARRCTGKTDWGIINLEVRNGSIIERDIDICKFISGKQKIIRLR